MLTLLREILKEKGETVHTAGPEEPVSAAVRRMAELRIGALPVTYNGRLVGIFSERDVLVRIVDDGLDPQRTPVADVMTPQPESVAPTTTLEAAMRLMSVRGFRHLPVLDEGRLVGLVSIRDLNDWLIREQQSSIDRLIRTVHTLTPHG
jgi:CBS domain-containing protein